MAPLAPQHQHTWRAVTGDRQDPWAYLKDPQHPDTIPYLRAENTNTDAWFAAHGEITEEIYQEIKSRTNEDETSPPVHYGQWWYASKTVAGSGYAIHTRGRTRELAYQTVMLDENIESAGHDYFDLGTMVLAHDHHSFAWLRDTDGSEQYTLLVRDLTSSNTPDKILLQDTSNSGIAWSQNGKYLFYVTHDHAMRPNKLWRHKIGTEQSADVQLFDEPDERFNVEIATTRSKNFIVISTTSRITGESWLLDPQQPEAAPKLVRAREHEIEYHIDDWGDRFVILTNLHATDFRVMTAPTNEPGNWSEFIGHTPGQRIDNIDPFSSHLIVHEWVNAQQQFRAVTKDNVSTPLRTGTEPHGLEPESCPEYTSATFRYTHESLTSPRTVFDHDIATNTRVAIKTQEVLNCDLSQYVSHREWATGHDGTLIPLDIVKHRNTTNKTAPGLLYAYGSYEASMPPWFSVARLSLLDRGFVWALAHPRGGGELGRQWYLNGKLMNKRNTFRDVNSCARHLYANHVGADRLAVRGGSAGGLMVAACITSEPNLYGAAIAEVPFVDVINSMSDPSLPLTINEWDEWGDPRTEPAASYMLGYSPYDNTHAVAYPPLLVTAGLNDPRVLFHEPAKWVAKLRHLATTTQPLLFQCEMGAGHAGKTDRYEQWREEAKKLNFVITCLSAYA